MSKIYESSMLYSDEHFSCPNYQHDVHIGFRYREYPQGANVACDELSTNIIIFMLRGALKCDCCNATVNEVNEGHMIFLPVKYICNLQFSEQSVAVIMRFEKCTFTCVTSPMLELRKLVQYVNRNSNVLHINSQLKQFINLQASYLRNGVNCDALHKLKINEFFILLRHFYSKEQVAGFLSPMLGRSQEFRLKCLRMRADAHNITEMVSLSGMSKTKFYEEFRKEFGDINPKKWFDSYLEYKIMHQVCRPGVTVKELAYSLDFESEAAFSQYCHRHFGMTASELIKKSAVL